MKLIIVFALLLLSTSAVLGQLAKTNITKDSFALAPKAIIDTSQSGDKLFADAFVETLFYSAGDTADTLYIWLINWDFESNATKSIIKRAIDASTLEKKGDDATLDLQLKSKLGLIGHSGIGYIGFVLIRDDGKDTADQLYFTILPNSATSDTKPVEVKLTDNSDKGTGFFVNQFWFQDGYFYVMYTEIELETGFEEALNLQAIKAEDGSLLFKETVKVASLNSPLGFAMPVAGADSPKDAKLIYIAYKVNDTDKLTVMQTTVDISNGKVDEPTKLVADEETVRYFPHDVITADTVFGIVVARQELKGEDDILQSLNVYYNGTTSKPQLLKIKHPEDYKNPSILSFNYNNGFIVLATYSTPDNALVEMKGFNSDGSEQFAEKRLLYTQTVVKYFKDASGGVWLGYNDFDVETGKILKSYLGKVIALKDNK